MPRIPFRLTRLGLAGIAVLLPLAVGACTNDEPRRITYATWKQAEPVPQPQLVQVPVHHTIMFPASTGDFTEAEREALAIFLRRNGIEPGGRVTLSAALPTDGNAAVLGTRLAAVRGELANLGFGSATLPPGTSPGAALPPETVVVTARVLTVGAIPCPGYNTPIQFDLEHRPELSVGCANAVNLGLMVADPRDLQGTNDLSPADGAAVIPSIERYRTDKVWPESPQAPWQVPFRETITE